MNMRDEGDGSLSSDSAEWYVEAGLNYSYTDLGTEYNDALVDSVFFSIPLTNGWAAFADVAAAYNTLGPIINGSNTDGESHVVIVDVTGQSTPDELVITAAFVVGSGYEKALNTTYGPNDYWYWGGQGSTCACLPNTAAGTCADKKIQARINAELTVQGNNVYMVSVETWTVLHYADIPSKIRAYFEFPAPVGVDNPVSGDGVRDYRTFSCQFGNNCTSCLNPTDMSFHTQGTWDVMNLIKAQHCPTKRAQQCTVDWGLVGSHPSTLYLHYAQFRYGIIPK